MSNHVIHTTTDMDNIAEVVFCIQRTFSPLFAVGGSQIRQFFLKINNLLVQLVYHSPVFHQAKAA